MFVFFVASREKWHDKINVYIIYNMLLFISGFKEEDICTPKKRRVAEPRYVSEICVSDVATPRKAKRVISLVKRNEAKKQKIIEELHRQKRDLLKRITCLEDMVKHLRQKGLMSESAGESVMVMYETWKKIFRNKSLLRKYFLAPKNIFT